MARHQLPPETIQAAIAALQARPRRQTAEAIGYSQQYIYSMCTGAARVSARVVDAMVHAGLLDSSHAPRDPLGPSRRRLLPDERAQIMEKILDLKRKDPHLSQTDAAAQAGIAFQTLNRWLVRAAAKSRTHRAFATKWYRIHESRPRPTPKRRKRPDPLDLVLDDLARMRRNGSEPEPRHPITPETSRALESVLVASGDQSFDDWWDAICDAVPESDS